MKFVWRNLPAFISLALLAAAVVYMSRQQDRITAIVAACKHIAPMEIVGATLLMILSQLVMAWRCTVIYERDGIVRPNLFWSNTRIQLIALFASLGAVVPGFADVAKGTLVKLRFDIPIAQALKLVIHERIATAVGMMTVGVLVLPLSFAYHLPRALILAPAGLWLSGFAVFGLLVWLGRKHISVGQPKIDGLIRALTGVGELYRNRRTLLLLTLAGVLQIGLVGMSFALLAKGMGLHIAPTIFVLFIPFIVFVFSLPIFYLGWGGREAMVMMTIGSIAHLATTDALALSAGYGVIVFLAAIPGAIFWLLRPSMRKTIKDPVPAAADQQSARGEHHPPDLQIFGDAFH